MDKSKTCFKCGAKKPLTDFYKHPRMSDGHVNKCKSCNKKDVRENRRDKLDHYRRYDIMRGNRCPKGHMQRYLNKNPERSKSRYIVSNAVRDGKIKKFPCCQHCGNTKNIVGHHSHYDMPLVVTWLCQGCHIQLHRDFERYKKGELVDYSWADET